MNVLFKIFSRIDLGLCRGCKPGSPNGDSQNEADAHNIPIRKSPKEPTTIVVENVLVILSTDKNIFSHVIQTRPKLLTTLPYLAQQ